MRDIIPQDLHRFIMGEFRTDGWKSQWRQDLEAYMAEPKAPVRVSIHIVPKVKTRTRTRLANSNSARCGCGVVLRSNNRSGLCGSCFDKQRAAVNLARRHELAKKCVECGKPIRSDSKWDKCRLHSTKERRDKWNRENRARKAA